MKREGGSYRIDKDGKPELIERTRPAANPAPASKATPAARPGPAGRARAGGKTEG